MEKGRLMFLVLWITLKNAGCKHHSNAPAIRILPGRLVPQFDFLRTCENVSTVFHIGNVNMNVDPLTNLMVINGNIRADRWIKKITKSVVQFLNCADFTESSCQLFQTWRLGEESCNLIAMKDAFWTPLFRNIRPDFNCPVAPGEYILQNGSLNIRILQRLPFPLEKYYWRFRLESFDPQLFNCAVMGARFLRSRS